MFRLRIINGKKDAPSFMIKLAQKATVLIAICLVCISSLSVSALVFAEEASAQSKLKKCRGDRVKNNCENAGAIIHH